MEDNNIFIPQQSMNRVMVVALERISQAFRTLLWDYAKKEQLSPIQIQFLVYIAAHPHSQSYVTEIAREFNLTAATVSDAVKSLEKKGLIKKLSGEKDKRRFRLRLTDSGMVVTKHLTNWQSAILEHLKEYSPETKQTVVFFLLNLLESLKKDNLLFRVKTCLSCDYFREDLYPEDDAQHHCILRDLKLQSGELRIDCPNYKNEQKIEGKSNDTYKA